MGLKRDLLIGLWVLAGIFSVYLGVLQLRFPDAAWERAAENFKRRGLVAKRTKRWDRSRVFTGTLTTIIGAVLIVMAAVAIFYKPTEMFTYPMTIVDADTGKTTTVDLTPEERKEYTLDSKGFMAKLAKEGRLAQ